MRVAASALSSVERKGTLDESESNHHQRRRSATSEEGDIPANEYGKATVTASLSLGKSEIKGALERYERGVCTAGQMGPAVMSKSDPAIRLTLAQRTSI